MLCQLRTSTVIGIEALLVDVEVNISGGLPGFHLVGLPTGAVREGAVRVRAALENSGFAPGASRITVNLAPADLRKDGAAFDLPIALGVIGASGQAKLKREGLMICGELALDGALKPLRGALSMARAVRQLGLEGIVLPASNVAEAELVEGIDVFGVESLVEAVALVSGEPVSQRASQARSPLQAGYGSADVDFSEVHGQADARLAAEIAAAGGHNLMLAGPPGAGKTMIARRLHTVLPAASNDEALEATMIHSVAGTLEGSMLRQRPFRSPHHTVSKHGLVGGGSVPRPGEASLAHGGVLFLDELPEFQRQTLEGLRQPLEDGQVTIARARHTVTFPARFMLVAAMNPCPCGYRGSDVRTCICGERQSANYINRISGPLWDRFDLVVPVAPVELNALMNSADAECSAAIAERVGRAREIQAQRYEKTGALCNANLGNRALKAVLALRGEARALLEHHAERVRPSARALTRICKVARTIADLATSDVVEAAHVALALNFQREQLLAA